MSTKKTSEPVTPESVQAIVLDKKILLLVTGGVAAYKAAYLARLFTKNGAVVRTALTEGATHFITPLSFESLTNQKAISSIWDRGTPEIEHISWSEWADLLVVAPATANFLAQAASGLAPDFALAAFLAYNRPALLAPAMNSNMFRNPITQKNMDTLKGLGHHVMSPGVGLLACGVTGEGRMPEPEEIFYRAAKILSPQNLRGKKILITGGSTREPWDSIRFLSNLSTGLMGVELAQAAWLMGAEVELILGPMAKEPQIEDAHLTVTRIETTRDLLNMVVTKLKGKDALFMAAAPADFRPETAINGKIKKGKDATNSIPLAQNPDILKSIANDRDKNTIIVGFNADEEKILLDCAKTKLEEKMLDYIVANPAAGDQSSFASNDTSFHILKKGGKLLHTGRASKFSAAWTILNTVFSN
ncbi:MAG: bifunctional phosphopantothenoylcysteine decarboxylase/phosphopantothenate--cysteine ligase CoaBC [Deltaproteobacteria bacterium]|nr:bifunctional phosphopantothenoylcysteine decarboxylase/phosphopantothenate--cysteine ligase CoaBC [Deltaproteobacteria bacterium]